MQMMMPADIGAAAAYEAWRNWSAYQGTYMQPLSADRGRQREAFLGLAIGEGEPFYRIRFGFGRLSLQCSFKGRDALLHPMLARSLCSLRKKLMYLYSAARLWNYTANPMDTQSRLVAVEGGLRLLRQRYLCKAPLDSGRAAAWAWAAWADPL